MKFYIKEVEITNWKGVDHLKFNLTPGINTFRGTNGSFKTTLNDSFIWCLFGVDHFGRSDHEIKPLIDGEPKHHVESEVTLKLVLDEITEIVFKRVYREKWEKPRTKTEEVFKGNTTDYYINGVLVQKKEYDDKVAEICNPVIFKAVTNPLYVTSLTKDDQRKMLFSLVENVTDKQIAEGNKDFIKLLSDISGKTLESCKREINSLMTLKRKELNDIGPRISELNRNRPEVKDWGEIERQLKEKEQNVSEIESRINDLAKRSEEENKRRLSLQSQVNAIEIANQKIEHGAVSEKTQRVTSLNDEIAKAKSEIESKQKNGKIKKSRLDYLNSEKTRLQAKKDQLLNEYHQINAEVFKFDDSEAICPFCKRPFDIHDIEEKEDQLLNEFNKSKADRIAKNVKEGTALKGEIETIDAEIKEIGEIVFSDVTELENKIKSCTTQIAEINATPLKYKESEVFKSNISKIESLKQQLNSSEITSDNDLKADLNIIKEEIKGLNESLANRKFIENTNNRIEELENQKAALNQDTADLEKIDATIKDFEDAKSAEYENRINSLFSIVKFKLFRKQVDGQIVPDCECMVDGVLYSTLNTGHQVCAGLDIISVISKKKNFYAPIFIDNREGVVVDIPEMNCQIINLIADKKYKTITQLQSVGELQF